MSNLSKADEMFEELGYRVSEEVSEQIDKYGCGIQFKKEMAVTTRYIEFYYYHKQICIYEDQYIDDKVIRHDSCLLNVQELQAINQKCKELGWLDE